MTTLFLVNGLPYPPRSGAPLRCWHIINALARRGPIHVMSFGGREPGDDELPPIAQWRHYDRDDYRSSGGLRGKLGRLVRSRQFPLPDATAARAINADLRALIDRIRPDLVVLSHWKNELPSALAGRRDIVLDMHNVESLLGTDVKKVASVWKRRLILWRWRRRERRLIARAARIWTCSADDSVLVQRLGGRAERIFVVPNVIATEKLDALLAGGWPRPAELADTRPTLLFVGFYGYEPNAAAARRLIEAIFPRVRAHVADARLVLVGAEPTAAMTAAAEADESLLVTGKVDDVRPYLAAADVCVVPLLSGGGTRLKILEAFAAGIPVVSTAKGAEGIRARDGEHLIIAETDAALADAAVALLHDRERAQRIRDAARRLVEAHYSLKTLDAAVAAGMPPVARGGAAPRSAPAG